MNNSSPNRKIEDFAQKQHVVNDWVEHEHVSDAMCKEALHLLRMAGSAELAKQATDCIQEVSESLPAAAKDELARDLGYTNASKMMEQTEIVALPNGACMHLTVDSDGFWVAWKDKPFYDLQRFNSRRQAITSLREDAESIVLQS